VTDTVDQLLFGYRDGHELIAGSRELSPAQLRDVLPHIDASIEQAEERQLVGVWIPSLDAYLLARIWPAPERPRPGAVWGHALLVGADQLRRRALTGLPGLLRRPDGECLDSYLTPLAWPRAVARAGAERPLTRALVWAALGREHRPAVVLWDDPPAGEELLVALLDAFPAAARPRLSFRTRAQARLDAYGVVLAGAISGRTDQDVFVIDARRPPPETPPSWTNLLDAGEAAARQRAFLRRFGERDAVSAAQVFALIELAELLDAGAPPAQIVDALIACFPLPEQVPELRAALLGGADADGGLWALGEEQRLALLLEHANAFDLQGLAVSERLARLTEREPLTVLRLVEQARTFAANAAAAAPARER